MTKKRKTQKEVIEALAKSGGVISDAAKLLGMSRSHLSVKVNNTPALLEARNEALEGLKDKAESNLFAKIATGDVESSKWFLSKRARDRGYGERLEVEDKTPRQKPDLSNLTNEELANLEAIRKKLTDPGGN